MHKKKPPFYPPLVDKGGGSPTVDKDGGGGGARRWIKKATNVITLTWPMVDKIIFWGKKRKKKA